VSTRQKRNLFILAWVLLIISTPITLLTNTSVDKLFVNEALTINFFQRLFGLLAFILLFVQIMIGAFMKQWVQIIGAKAHRYHILQGLVAYAMVLIHPLFYSLVALQITGKLGFFLLPSGAFGRHVERFLMPGRFAFVLLTLAVIAGYFRTTPFFSRHWRQFHILNYVAFAFIALHARGAGTDVPTPPFVWVYYFAVTAVAMTVVYKLYLYGKEKVKYYSKKIPAGS